MVSGRRWRLFELEIQIRQRTQDVCYRGRGVGVNSFSRWGYKKGLHGRASVSMDLPAGASNSRVPPGIQVPAGHTVNGHQVPVNTYHQSGAAKTYYEKPRILSDRPVRPQQASRYRQYLNKYSHGNRSVLSGRTVGSSFSNSAGVGQHPVDDVQRNTAGIRERGNFRAQGTGHANSNQLRNYDSIGRPINGGQVNIPIESFDIDESVPLLASANSAAGSAAGIGAGAGAIAGGLVLGAGTTALVNRIKSKGAVLPGTDYVGPGNPINIDAPRSAVDVIAKEHDIGYQDTEDRVAKGELSEDEFVRQIDFLDNRAIEQFAEQFKTGGEWQAFLGKYGLWLKNRIERVLGRPIYPQFSGKPWVAGKIFLLMKGLIGVICTRVKGVMRTNNII